MHPEHPEFDARLTIETSSCADELMQAIDSVMEPDFKDGLPEIRMVCQVTDCAAFRRFVRHSLTDTIPDGELGFCPVNGQGIVMAEPYDT